MRPRIPLELFPFVVSAVDPQHKACLRNLLLASSLFHNDIIESLLYHSITLRVGSSDKESNTGWEARAKSMRAGLQNVRYVAIVRRFKLCILGHLTKELAILAREIMQLTPDIEQLELSWSVSDHSIGDLFHPLQYRRLNALKCAVSTPLKDLSLQAFLGRHPTIEHFEFTDIQNIWTREITVLPQRTLPCLRKLAVPDLATLQAFRNRPVSHLGFTQQAMPSYRWQRMPQGLASIQYFTAFEYVDPDEFMRFASQLPNLRYLFFRTLCNSSIRWICNRLVAFERPPKLCYLRLMSYYDPNDGETYEEGVENVMQDLFNFFPSLLIIDFCDCNKSYAFTRFFSESTQPSKTLSRTAVDEMFPTDEELETTLGECAVV
ncbi:hypothetical protein ONZ45_g383 [Pleurotus djamor]|nr:hypothetical protein ONZ45_g383 [Pleurotus djamor]